MPITQANSELLVRDLVDDPNSVRWSATAFPLYMDLAYDSLWRRLLTDRPAYNQVTETLGALTSPGTVNLADGGDLTNRFHGLRKLVRDSQAYGKADPRDVLLEDGAVVVAEDYTWMFFGRTQLHLFPYSVAAGVEITYNYLPAAWSSLASGATVTWPNGHEWAFVLYAAAMLSAKGPGVEDPESLYGLAELEYSRMLGSLTSQEPGPVQIYVPDSPETWGAS